MPIWVMPPQRVDVRLEPADLRAQTPGRPTPCRPVGVGAAGQRDELAQLRAHRDDVLGERGAALEAQRHVGDPPAVVLGADPVA